MYDLRTRIRKSLKVKKRLLQKMRRPLCMQCNPLESLPVAYRCPNSPWLETRFRSGDPHARSRPVPSLPDRIPSRRGREMRFHIGHRCRSCWRASWAPALFPKGSLLFGKFCGNEGHRSENKKWRYTSSYLVTERVYSPFVSLDCT